MVKYCRADVVLLSKATLKFRKMFVDGLDVDPFRYVTLASLCMGIYLNKFLPEKSIVGNSNEKDSIVAREWLIYLDDRDIIPEAPITVDLSELKAKLEEDEYARRTNKGKFNPEITYYKTSRHYLHVDGFNRKKAIVYEFNGCYWHGCPKCHPKLQLNQ